MGHAVGVGVATLAVLVAAIVAAANAAPAAPRHIRKPLSASAALQVALRATLASSFRVWGTISEGRGSGSQLVTGSVDLPRHLAQLSISFGGPGSATEQVLLVPGHTYQTLLAPASVQTELPAGTRWVADNGALSGLVLGADNALSALVPGAGQIRRLSRGPGRGGSYLLSAAPAGPAATTGGPALPANMERFTVDARGRIVAVDAVSYARTPFGQGGLAGVLETTASLHLSGFGAAVHVRPPPADETVSATVYQALLQAGLPPAARARTDAPAVGRQRQPSGL